MRNVYCLIICLLLGYTGLSNQNEPNIPISTKTYSSEELINLIGRAEEESPGPLITGINLISIINTELPGYYIEPNLPIRVGSSGVQYFFKKKDHETAKIPPSGLSLDIGIFENREKAILSLGQRVLNVSVGLDPLKGVGDRAHYKTVANNQRTSLIFRRKNVVVGFRISLPSDQAIAFAKKIDDYFEHDKKFVTRGEKVELPRIKIKDIPSNIKLKESVKIDFELVNVDPNEAIISGENIAVLVAETGKIRTMNFIAPRVKEQAGLTKVTLYLANQWNVFSVNEFMINVAIN